MRCKITHCFLINKPFDLIFSVFLVFFTFLQFQSNLFIIHTIHFQLFHNTYQYFFKSIYISNYFFSPD